jgi:hypothetical protein
VNDMIKYIKVVVKRSLKGSKASLHIQEMLAKNVKQLVRSIAIAIDPPSRRSATSDPRASSSPRSADS